VAGVRDLQAREELGQRRLARAVRADQRHHLALVDAQRNLAQRRGASARIREGDLLGDDPARRRWTQASRRSPRRGRGRQLEQAEKSPM
jgi:hypothetical protein